MPIVVSARDSTGFDHLTTADDDLEDDEDDEIEETEAESTEDERRFTLQKLLLAYTSKKHMSAVRATAFIRDEAHQLQAAQGYSLGRPVTRFQPHRRKEIIQGVVRSITSSPVMDWSPREFERIFDLSSREEIEQFMGELKGGVASCRVWWTSSPSSAIARSLCMLRLQRSTPARRPALVKIPDLRVSALPGALSHLYTNCFSRS
jgi:hypothetical protein